MFKKTKPEQSLLFLFLGPQKYSNHYNFNSGIFKGGQANFFESANRKIFARRKNYVFAEVLNPQKIIGSTNRKYANRKKIKSQVRKLLHLRKVRKSKKNYGRKFTSLRFAELIRGPPTFAIIIP